MSRLPALAILILVISLPVAAAVEILTPTEGSQALGPIMIEARVTTIGVDRVNFYVDGVLIGIDREAPYQAAFDFGDSLAARRVEVEVLSDSFRTSERRAVTTSGTSISDTIEVNLVEVPLRIRTGRTRIGPEDLRVAENGRVQRVAEVRAERLPTTFIFVVDRSLSMGDGKLRAALDAVEESLAQLRPGDDAQLTFFNHRPEAPRPIDGTLGSLREVEPAGGTSLRDTLLTVRPARRAAIVVVSDGGDRNSVSTEEEALRAIGSGNTVLYALALGSGSGAAFLQRAAARTGGTFGSASAGSLGAAMSRVIADINSRYTLVYQSNLTAAGWRDIRVSSTRPRTAVSAAKRGYFAR